MSTHSINNLEKPRRIAVLNSKGGCGKSMISTNLASMFASKDFKTALIDHDPQNTSMRWLNRRSDERPVIHGINAASQETGVTKSFRMRLPQEIQRVIVDTPAGVRGYEIGDFIRENDYVIIPVMTSEGDLNAAEYFFSELHKHAKIRNLSTQVCIVANRAKKNTNALQAMKQFMETVHYPCLCILHDTQNYVTASEQGIGITEMPHPSIVKEELRAWKSIYNWIENKQVDFVPDDVTVKPKTNIITNIENQPTYTS